MKAIWKVLIGAAAVAAVAPYQVKKDEETGVIELKAATWSGTYSKEGKNVNVTVHPLPGIIKAKDYEYRDGECECDCCASEEESGDEGEITIEVVEEPAAEEPAAGEPKPEEA